MTEMGLFEAIYTQRAIRKFTDEEVRDEEIHKLIDAAIRAPSASNTQPWEFIIIRDPERKKAISEYYRRSFQEYYAAITAEMLAKDVQVAKRREGMRQNPPEYLAEHMHEVPALILVCLNRKKVGIPADHPMEGFRGAAYAAVLPAVQNLLLAARGMGLGSVLTTLHTRYEGEIKGLLGIPPHVQTVALLPIGRPATKYGPVKRDPVEKVTHWETWGRSMPAPAG